jgi:hypothetical protein
MKSQKTRFFGNLKNPFSSKLIAIVMFLALALSVHAVGGAEVKASILRYEPTPAEQGNTVEVWVQLSNAGTKAERVALKFVPEYPFSLPAGQPVEVDVGTIAATEDKVEKFTVFVDPQAPNGENDITFLYKYSADQWIELEAPLTLQSQDAVLVIDEYDIAPSPIVPGQMFEVRMKLRNAGRIAVKNLDVGIDLEDGKFSTIGTGTKQRVKYVGAGETTEVTFTLASDTSTEVRLYTVPVSLMYQDDRNKDYTDTARISLVVNAEPELSMTVDATDYEKKTKPGTVSLKVVNKGVVDLKYLTVVLIKTPEYEILSPSNEAYVGNLDSDDFETVDFIVKPLVDSPRLKVALEFKDPYNVDFREQWDLPLRIITEKELGKKKPPYALIALGIIVVLGVIYWWRKKGKKKRR